MKTVIALLVCLVLINGYNNHARARTAATELVEGIVYLQDARTSI